MFWVSPFLFLNRYFSCFTPVNSFFDIAATFYLLTWMYSYLYFILLTCACLFYDMLIYSSYCCSLSALAHCGKKRFRILWDIGNK